MDDKVLPTKMVKSPTFGVLGTDRMHAKSPPKN